MCKRNALWKFWKNNDRKTHDQKLRTFKTLKMSVVVKLHYLPTATWGIVWKLHILFSRNGGKSLQVYKFTRVTLWSVIHCLTSYFKELKSLTVKLLIIVSNQTASRMLKFSKIFQEWSLWLPPHVENPSCPRCSGTNIPSKCKDQIKN